MGCDIHFYVEYYKKNEWVSADVWEEDEGYHSIPYHHQFYNDRNYLLFGILAGVRSGIHKAIDSPRGLPFDLSKEVKSAGEEWGSDAHSHSWYYLEELINYQPSNEYQDETKYTEFGYWADKLNLEELLKSPDYYGEDDVNNTENVVTLSEQEYIDTILTRSFERDKEYHIQAKEDDNSWTYFKNYTISRMRDVAISYGCSLKEVRCVFWFDN